METNPFFAFLALVTQDAAIVRLNKKREEIAHKKERIHAAHALLREAFTKAQAEAHQARKSLDAQELEIKILHERHRALKNKLLQASSPKEYFSLETEIAAIQQSVDDKESALFEFFERYEALEKKKGELDFQLITSQQETHQELALLETQEKEVLHEREEHQGIYEELKPQVNPEMLEKFLSMKENLENPVVPVEKNHCSACFSTLSAQELVNIRKHVLISCQNCFRLLYAADLV